MQHPLELGRNSSMASQQIIYTSAAVKDLNEVMLSRILLSARKRNASLGITGMLLYDDGSFLQVLEGDKSKVESLFERIGEDPRHCRVMVLLERSIEGRQFQDWSMGFVDAKSVAGGLPGYSDFLQKRDDAARGNLAIKMLTQFCEGKLRSMVRAR